MISLRTVKPPRPESNTPIASSDTCFSILKGLLFGRLFRKGEMVPPAKKGYYAMPQVKSRDYPFCLFTLQQ